jgi:hypothetical protein
MQKRNPNAQTRMPLSVSIQNSDYHVYYAEFIFEKLMARKDKYLSSAGVHQHTSWVVPDNC